MNLSSVNRSLALLERLFDARHATEPFIPPTKGKPKWQHIGEKSAPFVNADALAAAGVPLDAFAAYLTKLRDTRSLNTHGVVLFKNGEVLARVHYGAHDLTLPRYVYSASKTVTAMAIGVLIDAGALAPSDKITDLFSQQMNPVTKRRLSALTVEDLLTMRSAVTFSEGEAMTDGDWVKGFLGASLSGDMGKTFHYNSLNTYMLSAIVTKKTGKSLGTFVREHFFAPLGIEATFWEACPKDNSIGGWGLYITPADLCKLGCVLFDGTYAGKRYLSERFVRTMTSVQAEVPREKGAYDYGYQIWVHPQSRVALMNGMFGQNVFLDARTGIALAVCSGNDEVFQQSETYPQTEAFLASVGTEHTPTEEEKTALAALVSTLCEHRAAPVPAPTQNEEKQGFLLGILSRLLGAKPTKPETRQTLAQNPTADERAAAFVGKAFIPQSDLSASLGLLPVILQAVRNHYAQGFVSISVGALLDGALPVIWREKEDTHTFSVGMDGMSRRTWLVFGETPYLIDAKGSFTANEDGDAVLRMELHFSETAHTRILKLFSNRDGTYTLSAEETPGAALLWREAKNIKRKAEAQPIIGGVLAKIDDDYLAYRIGRTFATRIAVEAEK